MPGETFSGLFLLPSLGGYCNIRSTSAGEGGKKAETPHQTQSSFSVKSLDLNRERFSAIGGFGSAAVEGRWVSALQDPTSCWTDGTRLRVKLDRQQ